LTGVKGNYKKGTSYTFCNNFVSFVTRRELCDPVYSGRRGHEVHKDTRRARRI